jgi:REP element-mobilizing transposase RayT
MARKLRVQFESAIYHVTIRGVERRRIFDDDADRERFLKRLGEAVEEYGVRLYLFCCMVNHVHILCETPQASLPHSVAGNTTVWRVPWRRSCWAGTPA